MGLEDGGYEQMTFEQLRAAARNRSIRRPNVRKAEFIAQLRELDRRKAAGEPEDESDYLAWRFNNAVRDLRNAVDSASLEAAQQRVRDLRQEPGHSPGWYAGVATALRAMEPPSP